MKRDDEERFTIPRRPLRELVPRRNLWLAVVLLAMLVGVLMVRRRAGSIADTFSRVIFPPHEVVPAGIRATVRLPDAAAGGDAR